MDAIKRGSLPGTHQERQTTDRPDHGTGFATCNFHSASHRSACRNMQRQRRKLPFFNITGRHCQGNAFADCLRHAQFSFDVALQHLPQRADVAIAPPSRRVSNHTADGRRHRQPNVMSTMITKCNRTESSDRCLTSYHGMPRDLGAASWCDA